MSKRNVCPNCGAPFESTNKCPFCGTLYYDFSCIPIHGHCSVCFDLGDQCLSAVAQTHDFVLTCRPNEYPTMEVTFTLFDITQTNTKESKNK